MTVFSDIAKLIDAGYSVEDAFRKTVGYETSISTNTTDIATNTSNISTNTTNIALKADIPAITEFTVTLTPDTGTITLDSAEDTLACIKVGRFAMIQGRIKVSSVSSPTGQLVLNGLPYALGSLSKASSRSTFSVEYFGITALSLGMAGQVSGTTVLLKERSTTSSFNAVAAKILSTTYLYFNFSYITA